MKNTVRAITVSILCIFVICSLFGCNNKKTADSNNTTVGYMYMVKEFNGKVAVFIYGSDTPVEVLDCIINTLPQQDIEELKIGISVRSDTELQQLIEAFD